MGGEISTSYDNNNENKAMLIPIGGWYAIQPMIPPSHLFYQEEDLSHIPLEYNKMTSNEEILSILTKTECSMRERVASIGVLIRFPSKNEPMVISPSKISYTSPDAYQLPHEVTKSCIIIQVDGDSGDDLRWEQFLAKLKQFINSYLSGQHPDMTLVGSITGVAIEGIFMDNPDLRIRDLLAVFLQNERVYRTLQLLQLGNVYPMTKSVLEYMAMECKKIETLTIFSCNTLCISHSMSSAKTYMTLTDVRNFWTHLIPSSSHLQTLVVYFADNILLCNPITTTTTMDTTNLSDIYLLCSSKDTKYPYQSYVLEKMDSPWIEIHSKSTKKKKKQTNMRHYHRQTELERQQRQLILAETEEISLDQLMTEYVRALRTELAKKSSTTTTTTITKQDLVLDVLLEFLDTIIQSG